MPRSSEIDIREFMNQKKKIPILNKNYDYVTPKDYAKIAGLHPVTVIKLLGKGKIEGAVKLGGRWRIPVLKSN